MSRITKTVDFWRCCLCAHEWLAKGTQRSRQCPNCGRRGWDSDMAGRAPKIAKPAPIWRPTLARLLSPAEVRARKRAQAISAQNGVQAPGVSQ